MSDIKEILKERGNVHGEFADNADISQELKKTVRRSVRWGSMSAVQREAVDNVLQKIARLCSGDPDYEDHWVDIIGYTTLSKDRLPGPKDVKPEPTFLHKNCRFCNIPLQWAESKKIGVCMQCQGIEAKGSVTES